ncbi:AraC family transcriptional regulator [Mucilaginibacter rubeus]|uniref:Helix-turn-helix domain-containing protein n=1 Tax=Mucilaginibacter rubeus TaxID=2027860 RepID=A0A5C1HUQ9_9SPHI|nr:AraC family transcriptional regulator [Mucilaginibacter rubeus]QEM09636.1 helix-turn-helix domain-containing protein [Mucilaginibacter rubeus]
MKKPEHPNIIADQDIKDSFSVESWEKKHFDDQRMHRATYNRIFLITSGSGEAIIDNSSYPIAGDQLLLVAKGQLFTFSADTVLTGHAICFGDCFWERAPQSANNCKAVLFNNASDNQQIPLNNDDLQELSPLFEILHTEFTKAPYINKLDAMAAYLKIIMIKIANINASLSKGYDSYDNQLYRQFLELVSRQYQNTHEVAEFAKQMGISTRKLTELCNRCAGKGAKDIINGQLISEAKRSLQFSAKPVKEIAYHLNFSTPEQFSHFFKKNTMVSPHQYRSHFVHIGM